MSTTLQCTRAAWGLMVALSLLLMTPGIAGEPEQDQPNVGSVQPAGCHQANMASTAEVLTGRAEFCASEANHDRDLSNHASSLNFSPLSQLGLEFGGYDIVGRRFGANSPSSEISERPTGGNPPPQSWRWASASWRF